MNKAVRYSFIALFLISLMIILSSSIVLASCCYSDSSGTCISFYGGTKTDCLTQENDTWIPDNNCLTMPECREFCCCEGKIPKSNVTQRFCELNQLYPIVETTEIGCEAYCEDEIPPCKPDCQLNDEPCIGKTGLLSEASGRYYCSVDGSLYDSDIECLLCEFPDCELGEKITSKCMCGGSSRDTGFCCLDNTYDPDPSGSGCLAVPSCTDNDGQCPPGCTFQNDNDCPSCTDNDGQCPPGCTFQNDNDCPSASTCQELGPTWGCADACDPDYGQNSNFNYWLGNCPEELPLCCQEPAPSYSDCCDQYEECTGIDLSQEPTGYEYWSCNLADSSKTPCSASCLRLDCSQGDWKINSGVNQHATLDHCYCGVSYHDIYSDEGYCCPDPDSEEGRYQLLPCTIKTGNISGRIYNSVDLSGIPGAEVVAYLEGIPMKSIFADEEGNYVLEGLYYNNLYTIQAAKPGFYFNQVSVDFLEEDLTGRNIPLTPYTIGPCDSCTPPPPELTAEDVKGKASVNLAWDVPSCSLDEIDEFMITRSPEHPLGTIRTSSLSFIDTNVSWEERYSYSISAHYKTGAKSSTVSTTITLGSRWCEGIYDDQEFCLDKNTDNSFKQSETNLYRLMCDENNDLASAVDSSIKPPSSISSCVDEKEEGYVCAGPDSSGKTSCVHTVECKEKAEFNLLGLYYSKTTCIGIDPNLYCYYDYSSTIIDKCDNCTGMTCYNYTSEDACLTDHCEASGIYINRDKGNDSPCRWLPLWEEFGKGICYDPDYDGALCSLCGSEADLFYNTNCTQKICSGLGSCYSNTLDCLYCESSYIGRTTCETYKTKEACIGYDNQELNFETTPACSGIPLKITPSDDACGLGVCKWDQVDGCYKDADDDDMSDCTPDDKICQKDLKAPVTSPQKGIPNMNASGYNIRFTTDDIIPLSYASEFYYCIDKDNSCCPDKLKNFADGSVSVNPSNDLGEDASGIYYLRYYSVDNHKNTEEVKSLSFYIDKVPPEYTVTYTTGNYTSDLSNLSIDLQSQECVICNYSLSPSLGSVGGIVVKDEFIPGRVDKSFRAEFKGLPDGSYTLSVTCRDDINNPNNTDLSILIDSVKQIDAVSPDFKTLSSKTISFFVNTTDASSCIAKDMDGILEDINITQLLKEYPNKFVYASSAKTFEDGTYHFEVDCTPVLGRKPDVSFIQFTVDTIKPSTIVTKGVEEFDFDRWYNTPFDIELECTDPDQGHQPGEFGCDKIRYCTKSPCPQGDYKDYTGPITIEGSSSISFTYYSIDKGGNMEDKHTDTIKIDNTLPSLSISTPSSVVDTSLITLSGGYTDTPSSVKQILIQQWKGSDFRLYRILNPSSTFSTQIELSGGINEITASLETNSGVISDSPSLSIVYDVYPPVFTEVAVLDENQNPVENDLNKHIEYGYPANISSQITDSPGIGVDKAEAVLSCSNPLSGCSSFQEKTYQLVQANNYFAVKVLDLLPVGNYTVTFRAWDKFSNYAEQAIWFLVKDTHPPPLALIPSEMPSTVYSDSYTITGKTSALADITVVIYDEDGLFIRSYTGTKASDVSSPEISFKDEPLSPSPSTGTFPQQGENELYFDGSRIFDLSPVTDHIGFSYDIGDPGYSIDPTDPVARYKITGVSEFMGGVKTKVVVTPVFDHYIDGSDARASAYTSSEPTGYFQVPIILDQGINNIKVESREESGSSSEVLGAIAYNPSGLNIIQVSPEPGALIEDPNFASLEIAVTTDFPAECFLSHEGNSIAKAFDSGMASSLLAGTKHKHSMTLTSSDCTNQGGVFCYINNDETTPKGINHEYTVKCSPSLQGMDPAQKDISFSIRTWYVIGSNYYGRNICYGSTGCAGVFPQLVCSTDGSCDNNCPSGCTVSEDPDCSCSNDNNCCPSGCTISNDNDCQIGGPGGEHD